MEDSYILAGGLARDNRRLESEPYGWQEPEQDPVAFANRLPADAKRSFLELVRMLQEGELRQWYHFRPDSLGRDLRKGQHAYRLTDSLCFFDDKKNWIDDHYALATDGSFNLNVLLTDGRVATLSREFDGIIADAFSDLDSYLFTMLRLSLTPSVFSREETMRLLSTIEGAEEYVGEMIEEE
jgi:hypothetical protein